MFPVMDRIKQIILVPAIRMELSEISVQMGDYFCRQRIIPDFITFSMKPDLDPASVTDDIAQCHADQFIDPAARFISMDHGVLIAPSISGLCIRSCKNGLYLIRSEIFKFRICLALELMDRFRFQISF